MNQKLTVFRKKGFGSFIKTAFYVWPAEARRKKLFFFWKNYNVFFCLWVSARKILVIDEKYMVALLDLLSTCLANMSRILVKLNIFSQLSGFEQNEVGLLVENFPQDCRNYIIRVQKIIFRRGFLCGWKIFPKFFWIKGVSYLQFWRFFFGMVAKHEFNLSSRTFGENNFWEKSLRFCRKVWTISKNDLVCWRERNYHFGFFDDKIQDFVKKFCWFMGAEFRPLEVLLWAEQYLLSSEIFLMDYSHPARSSAGIIELHSTFPIKTFGNFFASKYKFQSSCCDFGKKLPRMLEKNWRLHQNWTLSARGVSHEEVFFQKMTWSRFTFTSGGRPPAGVSKVIYTCFGQCFEEKHSFRRNYNCFFSLDCNCKKWCFVVGLLITLGQWAKNLQFSGKKDSEASSKLHFTFGRQELEEKNCFFLKKTQCFILFGSFGQKNSDYRWKVYGSFVGFALYLSSQHAEGIG